jgi:pimeloyl-ACP methyl ester carboxylesterase
VRALAKLLELDSVAMVGFSAGGPHAAVCAHELDRVEQAAIVQRLTR